MLIICIQPLHVAIKHGHKALVKTLLAYSKSTVLMRDIDGKTPLHCAAKLQLSDITQQLIVASPPEILFMEDAVGHSPFEIVRLAQFTKQFGDYKTQVDNMWGYSLETIRPNSLLDNHSYVFHGPKEEPLLMMKDVVQRLAKDERIARKIKADVMLRWIERTVEKAKVFKARQEKREQEEAAEKKKQQTHFREDNATLYPSENGDLSKTYKIIKDAVAALSAEMPRQLIHVLDVQASVNATLEKVAVKEDEDEDEYSYGRRSHRRRRLAKYGVEGELEPEEDEDKKARKASIVLQSFQMGADKLV